MTERTQKLASRWKRLEEAVLDSFILMAAIVPVKNVAGMFNQSRQDDETTLVQQLLFSAISFERIPTGQAVEKIHAPGGIAKGIL